MPDSSNESLKTALEQIRSDDALVQNEGVAALIAIGKSAVAPLLQLLGDESAQRRAQAMYALSQIGEPHTAEAFERGLRDEDERVRAYAAQGLSRINHPDALAACLQTLNDAPDEAHLDITPAVQALGQMGMSAIPALLDLLLDEDEFTRLHAQRALEMALNRRHGFQPGQGFPTQEAEQRMWAEWRANGDYDYSADAASRAAAVEKWRHWLAQQQK